MEDIFAPLDEEILCAKSDYGHDLSQLNDHEQVFMAMD